MIFNLRPKQTAFIPWGWRNEKTPWGPVCVEPAGKIEMPHLADYFDWERFTLEKAPDFHELKPPNPIVVTKDMKSVFQTAARFLGFERLLVEQPSLRPITRGFLSWNRYLLRHAPVHIDYFIIGDDWASNLGLFIAPDLWRSWIKPELMLLVDLPVSLGIPVILHSDGDISAILDDLNTLDISYLHPIMDVKRLEGAETGDHYGKMKLLKAFPNFEVNDYAPD